MDPFGLSMTTSTAPKPVEPESGRGAEARRQRAARHLMGQSGDGGGKKPPPDSQTGCKGNANCQNAAAKLKAAGKDPFANGFKRKWQDYGAGATDDFCAMMDGIDTPLCRKQEAPENGAPDPRAVVGDLAKKKPDLFGDRKCVECAKEIESALKNAGLTGKRYRLTSAGGIGRDGVNDDKRIEDTGVHEWVVSDGIAFDNWSPEGLSEEAYKGSLVTTSSDYKIEVVSEF